MSLRVLLKPIFLAELPLRFLPKLTPGYFRYSRSRKLLGKGGYALSSPEQAKPMRIQGAFVSDKETATLTSFIKNQGVGPQYTEEVTSMSKSGMPQVSGVDGGNRRSF